MINCPIWQLPAIDLPTSRDGRHIISSRAGGQYFIAHSACAMLSDFNVSEKILLTSWLVEQRRRGVSSPKISTATLKLARKRRPLSVHAKAINLLRYIRTHSNLLGTNVVFKVFDDTQSVPDYTQNSEVMYEVTVWNWLAWTDSQQMSEVSALAEHSREQGWIDHSSVRSLESSCETFHVVALKPSGYAHLDGLADSSSGSNQAFVAMWFDESMEDAYEMGIAPAIQGTGYEPLRIDRKEHNNRIDAQVFTEINRSRFLVADFTNGNSGARGGVYFEAGYALGRNIPVIFTCRASSFEDVHFDTRQYNHIVWETPDELMDRLAQRIAETLNDGQFKILDSLASTPTGPSRIPDSPPTTFPNNPPPIPPIV